jgi:methylglutaconyl-CoA hydratase
MSVELTRIRVESDGPIARITLARPEQKNALDQETAQQLLHALTTCAQHTDTTVILLDADGPDFCAGADLKALAAMVDAPPEVHYHDAELLGRVFLAMREIPKPIVAAVQGRALAGGAGLATACDLVLASETAQFGYPEVRVGFVPAMVMTMLRRCVGEKHAFDLISTGRRISAADAERIGLVSRVLPAERFAADVNQIVAELASTSPTAQRITKQLFYALDTLDFRAGVSAGMRANVDARMTDDFRTSVLAFANRGK